MPEAVDEAIIVVDGWGRPTEFAARFTELTAQRFAPGLAGVPVDAPHAPVIPATRGWSDALQRRRPATRYGPIQSCSALNLPPEVRYDRSDPEQARGSLRERSGLQRLDEQALADRSQRAYGRRSGILRDRRPRRGRRMALHRQPAMPFQIDEAGRLFAETAEWGDHPRPVTEIRDNRSEPYISSRGTPKSGICAQGRRHIVRACFCYFVATTQLHSRGRATGCQRGGGPVHRVRHPAEQGGLPE